MVIRDNFIGFLLFTLTMLCFGLESSWAVPASYQAIQDAKQLDQNESPVVNEAPVVEYIVGNSRDPFEPEVTDDSEAKLQLSNSLDTPVNLPTFNIQGIVWGGNLAQVIIDGQVFKIGDVIKGARIVDISKEGISMFYNGRQQLISSPAVNMLQDQGLNPKGGTNETKN